MSRYSVIGLGKLGASMVAAIASRGIHVVGYDILEASVEAVQSGKAPVYETDLETTLSQHRSRITATSDLDEAIENTSISFVVVPTPSLSDGNFSTEYAEAAFREIGTALRSKDDYHLVVLTSTVLPGAMRGRLLPLLEAASDKRCGEDFGVCYSPEFIALGSIIENFLHPDFTLIGEYDHRSGDLLEEAYSRIIANAAPSRRMSLENAELTKISLNAFVTMKIAFANSLAELCEALPGGDVDVVSHALGTDKRIGNRYLRGGLGFGGPCFPRDNAALAWTAQELGAVPVFSSRTDTLNQHVSNRIARRVTQLASPPSRVALLGIGYKPATHVLEESQALEIARLLSSSGHEVVAYDPLQDWMSPPDSVEIAETIEKCLGNADVVVICTPDKAFKDLPLASLSPQAQVLDCWRMLGVGVRDRLQDRYHAIGLNLPWETKSGE